jgi:adenylate cyclase
MSVDVRRSTELMLKARSPEAFATFTTVLCDTLIKIVFENYGVFDKFTGDGILAFFPEFFTGEDAAFRVVNTADAAHRAFKRHYDASRNLFSSVLTDTGLGIGVDYGDVSLVQIADGLTVVGTPVVYACRLSAAPPGTTLVNQPAYEVVTKTCGGVCFTSETKQEIKNESPMLAYQVRANGQNYEPKQPDWRSTKVESGG